MAYSSPPASSSSTDKNKRKIAKELDSLKKYIETTTLAKKITTALKNCNILFHGLTNVPTIFREDIQAISILHQPCSNEDVFRVKLGALEEFFQVDPRKWKHIIEDFDPKMKRGNTLLIRWLDQQKIPYDHEKVKVWNAITSLRNASFPYHPTHRDLIKLVKFFGQSFPIDYDEFYESILRMFLDSLEMLQRILFGADAREAVTS